MTRFGDSLRTVALIAIVVLFFPIGSWEQYFMLGFLSNILALSIIYNYRGKSIFTASKS